jgi:hypothetical protein
VLAGASAATPPCSSRFGTPRVLVVSSALSVVAPVAAVLLFGLLGIACSGLIAG